MKIGQKKLMAKIAYYYYIEERNQNEIAKKLNIHRSTVSRLIKQAREQGIIEIKIKLDSPFVFNLEQYFKNKYQLKDILIVDNHMLKGREKKDRFFDEAAYYIYRNIDYQKTIGISWGSTVGQTVNHISNQKKTNATFVPLAGGPSHINVKYHVNTLIYELANKFNGESIFINATVVQETDTLAQGIMKSQYFQDILRYWEQLDLTIVGIGGELDAKKSHWRDLLQPHDYDSLKELNAVGDCCCRFYDENGELLNNSLQSRTISMTLEALKKVPQSIGIAYSEEKACAILPVIKKQYIDTLITDVETALEVLRLDNDPNVKQFTDDLNNK